MKIGVLKEIKNNEYRVALTPIGAKALTSIGHEVFIEEGAGDGVGFSERMYTEAGAKICSTEDVYKNSRLIVKVKEPLAEEYAKLTGEHILFTYLHLAPNLELTKGLISSGCIGIAYETVTDDDGTLPLLRPMSEIAGRISIQAGAYALEKPHGGSGTLLCGAVGVDPAKVLVLGGGVVGLNAARIAMGVGADVTIVDISTKKLVQIDNDFGPRIKTRLSTKESIEDLISGADLVVAAVLIPGAAAPKIITKDMLSVMKPGSAIVDVAIDQGGAAETSRPTSHANPTYIEKEIVHYCVTNMPGAVARTSTLALTNATLPFILQLAGGDINQLLAKDIHLKNGVNVYHGKVTNKSVADSLGLQYHSDFIN